MSFDKCMHLCNPNPDQYIENYLHSRKFPYALSKSTPPLILLPPQTYINNPLNTLTTIAIIDIPEPTIFTKHLKKTSTDMTKSPQTSVSPNIANHWPQHHPPRLVKTQTPESHCRLSESQSQRIKIRNFIFRQLQSWFWFNQGLRTLALASEGCGGDLNNCTQLLTLSVGDRQKFCSSDSFISLKVWKQRVPTYRNFSIAKWKYALTKLAKTARGEKHVY